MTAIRVGMFLPPALLEGRPDEARTALHAMADADLDHVGVSDHVSFFTGWGVDGLTQAAVLAGAEPRLDVALGVYLLPLRHPVTVARQLSTFSQLTDASLEFGVGVGGEDPHELEICGIDPRTRGRRLSTCLGIVRALINGETVDHHSEFFQIEHARITPPARNITIVCGGRADAALRRAGTLADGWIAAWVTAEKFAERCQVVIDAAASHGKDSKGLRFGFQPWIGLGPDAASARAAVAGPIEAMYRQPFGRFERFSPHGTPAEVADALRPYVEAGCTSFNIAAQSDDWRRSVDGVAEIRRLLTT